MERRTFTEKDSYKKWPWKEYDPEEVKILVEGKVPEMGEDLEIRDPCGDKKQRMHGDLGWQQPRLVMVSSGTAGTDSIFWRPSWVSSDLPG